MNDIWVIVGPNGVPKPHPSHGGLCAYGKEGYAKIAMRYHVGRGEGKVVRYAAVVDDDSQLR